jgi:Formyl transferase
MRTVLICHAEDDLNRIGTARWLASFTDLAGMVIIEEGGLSTWRRVRREVRRSGWLRFLDVLAFRVYYRLFLASADRKREQEILADLCERYPKLSGSTRILRTRTPNSSDTARFLGECAPDLVIARCKVLLKESIFTVPRAGTFVLHPGICPEYRNAHGCFWALANRDLANVGLTLLKIDRGVDTGPVYGYYRYPFAEAMESHIVIQHRSAFENLDAIAEKLREIHQRVAQPLDTGGRTGAVWGQPWLSTYLRWKRQAGRRR